MTKIIRITEYGSGYFWSLKMDQDLPDFDTDNFSRDDLTNDALVEIWTKYTLDEV